jgi:hypothetical protein
VKSLVPVVFKQALVSAGIFVTVVLGVSAAPTAAGEKHNVLVLAGRDSQQPAYELFMNGFRAGVNARAADRLELFTEFLDSSRFPQAEHRMRMRQLLQEKYAATKLALVISTSPLPGRSRKRQELSRISPSPLLAKG